MTTTTTTFRLATEADTAAIWRVLQGAIARRAADGSTQWQDGYPNPEVVRADVARGAGHVLEVDGDVVGYVALWRNDEPAYDAIDGQWSSGGDFVVFHRVAVADEHLGKGYAQRLIAGVEAYAVEHGVGAVRADTNHDNAGMLSLFSKRGYRRCGVVTVRGGRREAFDRLLP